MKRISTLLLGFGLLLAAPALRAQSFTVPTNVSLKVDADYKTYEPQVIAAVDWLEKTPGNVDVDKQRQTHQFLLQWASGAPNVAVQVMPYVTDLAKANPLMLGMFLGGWSRYSLQHPDEKDPQVLHRAALQTMLTAYQAGGYQADKNFDNLLALQRKNQLDAWLAKQLKRS